jgi:5-methylcytosine-specific restriction endonuclease McrA
MSQLFFNQSLRSEDYWRAIVLFGRNVASYKFALAKSLLELGPESGQLIKLDELARPFSRHVASHLKASDKQATSSTSKFLDSCRRFNAGEISDDQLVEKTVRLGFNNVIDAFHVVGADEIDERFFVDRRQERKGIEITDQFSVLSGTDHIASLPEEVEARWRLVETSWALGISRNLLRIEYDGASEELFAVSRDDRRTAVTSSRSALNGYQKGCCFYCFRTIGLSDESVKPDVDHFFPHVLKQHGFGPLIDGVWNLVLACRNCNRGPRGKWAKIPSQKLLERLFKRNNFLISSHHPLRETLIQQVGAKSNDQIRFLQEWHTNARKALIHVWECEEVVEPKF